MMVVMSVASILFLLSTTLLSTVAYQSMLGESNQQRARGLQLADAGLNAYTYEMSKDPDYFKNNPILGPVGSDDGTWTVTASAGSGSNIIITSVGFASGTSSPRIVMAQLGYPTFADYAMLGDTDITIGSGAVINGAVRMNGTVTNDGTVHGPIFASGKIKGSGHADASYPDTDTVDFNAVSTDIQAMQTAAQSDGSFFANLSGKLGYKLVLNGNNYSVYTVNTGNKSTGGLAYSAAPVRTGTVPPSGVIFFDADVWVRGNYDANITVASNYDVLLSDNLVRTHDNAPCTCGLVARSDVMLMAGYPTTELPSTVTIQAAWLALTGKAACDGLSLSGTPLRDKANILGSRAWRVYDGFVTSNNAHGFAARDYTYDRRLNINPPPMFPSVNANGHLRVVTWIAQ